MFRLDTPPARLRSVAFFEGLSYVILLFVAMPLKYLGGQPLAVRYVGMLHGLLFVVLVGLLLGGMKRGLLSRGRTLKVFVAALLPFGTLVLDSQLRSDQEAYGEPRRS